MKPVKIINSSFFQLKCSVKFFESGSCICFKIPEGMIEIEKKMAVFNFGLQIADFRFVRDLDFNLQSTLPA